MHRLTTPRGITVSYSRHGSGPPLALIHGGFSDHRSNWEFVLPLLEERFTIYAIARRGRGETAATEGHTLEDEAADAAALIQAIGEPVFLLGHSYGAHVALAAAAMLPERVRKLVLYEPPRMNLLRNGWFDAAAARAEAGDWEGFAFSFFHEVLLVPVEEIDDCRKAGIWTDVLADARASLGDLRALRAYDFQPERFSRLPVPVLLQVGTKSPPHLYATQGLLAHLPDARVQELQDQAHEGMTTAPRQYAEAVAGYLLEDLARGRGAV